MHLERALIMNYYWQSSMWLLKHWALGPYSHCQNYSAKIFIFILFWRFISWPETKGEIRKNWREWPRQCPPFFLVFWPFPDSLVHKGFSQQSGSCYLLHFHGAGTYLCHSPYHIVLHFLASVTPLRKYSP